MWQPVGTLDQAAVNGRVVSVSGWAVDPDDVDGAATVHVYVDGVGTAILHGDQWAADPSAYHGYSVNLAMAPGDHSVCTYGINVGRGSNNTLLGCRTVTVGADAGNMPSGFVEAVTSGRSVVVSGWALDPNAAGSPIDVHVYADGQGVAIRGHGAERPAAAAFDGAGSDHAFGVTVALPSGRHKVCGYGINVGAGGNALLGCRSVYLDPLAYNPVGSWGPARSTGPTSPSPAGLRTSTRRARSRCTPTSTAWAPC